MFLNEGVKVEFARERPFLRSSKDFRKKKQAEI